MRYRFSVLLPHLFHFLVELALLDKSNQQNLVVPFFQLSTNQVLDCQGLETVCLLITPRVITFPAQLSMSFNSSQKYGIRLNHGYLPKVDYSEHFYRFKRNYKSCLKITSRCKNSEI